MSTVITSISGLQNLTNLDDFRADWNSLQTVDLSGLTQLRYVDLSDCDTLDDEGKSLTSVNLTGSTAIQVLRLDDSNFSAGYPNISALTDLVELDMDECNLSGNIDLSAFSSLTNIDLNGNINITSVILPESDIDFLDLSDNALTQTSVNDILQWLDNSGVENGNVNLQDGTNGTATGAGLTAVTSLQNKGWQVFVNQTLPVMGITNTVISSTGATVTVSITDEANLGIEGAGLIVGTSPINLTMDTAIMVANVNSVVPGTRTVTITGLTPATTYYIRTWIELQSGGNIIYGQNANTILTNA
jgi:hypothetical protein